MYIPVLGSFQSATFTAIASPFRVPIAGAIVQKNQELGGTVGPNDTVSSFSVNGHSLVVADNAAGVVGATTAIHTLGIDAQVTDSIAGVDANSAGLIALGSAPL